MLQWQIEVWYTENWEQLRVLVGLSQMEIRGRCGTRMTVLNKDSMIGGAIRLEDVAVIFVKFGLTNNIYYLHFHYN